VLIVGFFVGVIAALLVVNVVVMILGTRREPWEVSRFCSGEYPRTPDISLVIVQDAHVGGAVDAADVPTRPRSLAVERSVAPTPAPPRWGNDRPVWRQIW
jgi:hypothetical protein